MVPFLVAPLERLDVEKRLDTSFLKGPFHSQEHDPNGFYLSRIIKELEGPQNPNLTVQVLQHLVIVRKGDSKTHRFISPIGKEDQIRNHQGLQILSQIVNLLSREGDEPPVSAPGLIVDLLDNLQFLFKAARVEGPDAKCRFPLLQPFHNPVQAI